jgi:hypothetical protein
MRFDHVAAVLRFNVESVRLTAEDGTPRTGNCTTAFLAEWSVDRDRL